MAKKFEKISHLFWKQVGDFFKFLWAFQNSWTLKVGTKKRVNKSYNQELLMIPGGVFRFFSEKLPINIRKLDNTVKHVSRCALYEICEKESFEK